VVGSDVKIFGARIVNRDPAPGSSWIVMVRP